MAPKFISAKYHAPTLTVDYARDDGAHLLRTGGTVAWRFNNPGNLRPKDDAKPIMGAIGVGTTKTNGSFLIFSSYKEGRIQKKALLRRKYNDRTLYTMLAGIPDKHGKLVNGYAPASDKNDPVAYANAISTHTGLSADTVLSTLNDDQLDKVMDAMEKKEGFHNEKGTRKEKWVNTTGITVSDGANPKPNLPAAVKVGAKTHPQRTDAVGQLPKIPHTTPGQKVEIHLPDLSGELKKQFEFVMDDVSQAYVIVHDLLGFSAQSEPSKAPPSPTPPRRTPIRYVIQYGDTVPRIARRFKCSVPSIMEFNPSIKDIDKIFAGQVIGIYGPLKNVMPRRSHTNSPAVPAPVTRSKEGTGKPLAIVQTDQRQAPWMIKAIAEGKRWAGADEKVINKTFNYHEKIGDSGNMGTVPWCASFVNFCLKSTGTPFEVSKSSQFACSSKKFVKIVKPVYGALMVMRNYEVDTGKFAGTGHVTFVYGRGTGNTIVAIGGNQHDSVRASPYKTSGVSSTFSMKKKFYHQKFHAFYIPATYAEFAKTEPELQEVDVEKVNRDLLGIKNATSRKNEKTR